MTDDQDSAAKASTLFWCVVSVLVIAVFMVLVLADSFFSWGVMPELVERSMHKILLWLIPME